MKEGWSGEDYLILFEDSEVEAVSERYSVSQFLPGFQIVGLRGWDDFIVRDSTARTWLVPTVPLDFQHLSSFAIPGAPTLEEDVRFNGKIKWHITPIVFGGDPKIGENMIWVDHKQHEQLVKWWNDKYRCAKAESQKHT